MEVRHWLKTEGKTQQQLAPYRRPVMLMYQAEINRKSAHVPSDPPTDILPANRPLFKSDWKVSRVAQALAVVYSRLTASGKG